MSDVEVVERVARALCEADGRNADAPSPQTPVSGATHPYWEDYRQQARSYIAAHVAITGIPVR